MSSTPLETHAKLGRHTMSDVEAGEMTSARRNLPGGVLGGNTLPHGFVFSHGKGGRFWDTSGNMYIDYVLGSGTLLLGHAHPAIAAAIADQATRGMHFFAYLNAPAVHLAERLVSYMPCAGRMRFTVSGSESTFHAIRLARGFTGKNKILKFEGAYHGTHDYAQVSTAPKQLANFPQPVADTAGIPDVVRDLTLVCPYNDLDTLRALVEAHRDDLAAVIIEPIQRIISPLPGFLAGVREITQANGVLMIMDEVVTGFRYGLKGAQGYFGVTPDLATYGKVIGSGLPVGAVAGREDIMDQADPAKKGQPGYVYQNGTLQGHPLGCAAGHAMLDTVEKPGFYDRVFAAADRLRAGLQEVFDRHDMGIIVFGEGPMWHMLFADCAPRNYRDILRSDTQRGAAFDAALTQQGIFVLPGNRRFISCEHTMEDLEATFAAVDRACRAFKNS
jgi:glutamate-1-semialdehyde 2,1-aminomutase